jgi:hypothetical protein
MARLFCVVRELPDDPRRGAGGTAQQINRTVGARHRWRALTEVALWNGSCDMRLVLARSFHAKSVRPSLPAAHGDVRLDIAFHPLSNAAYQRIPRRMTNAVSSKLSRSDFVAIGGEGIKQVTR